MQLHRRAVRQGFTFTVMVMGQSGLGKSTFINSLFLRDLRANRDDAERYTSTVDIKV
jgi:septin family protein